MSRVAKNPISVPKGVDVTLEGRSVKVKGPNGDLGLTLYPNLEIRHEDDTLRVEFSNDIDRAMAGTTRSLIGNMITGVTEGFQKKLTIVGVGYRAQAEGAKLNLSLGFSHPVVYKVPGGVSVETPTQTEVLIKGADKQKVGQVAAEIRGFRPPEPYKGKGIKYDDELIMRKEGKKK